MDILERLSTDPRALVEVYLNYDCDRTALENIFQGYVDRAAMMCNLFFFVVAGMVLTYV